MMYEKELKDLKSSVADFVTELYRDRNWSAIYGENITMFDEDTQHNNYLELYRQSRAMFEFYKKESIPPWPEVQKAFWKVEENYLTLRWLEKNVSS